MHVYEVKLSSVSLRISHICIQNKLSERHQTFGIVEL